MRQALTIYLSYVSFGGAIYVAGGYEAQTPSSPVRVLQKFHPGINLAFALSPMHQRREGLYFLPLYALVAH